MAIDPPLPATMPEFVARLEAMQRHLVERGAIDDGEAFRELMAWGVARKMPRGFIEDWPPECIPAAYQHLRKWSVQYAEHPTRVYAG